MRTTSSAYVSLAGIVHMLTDVAIYIFGRWARWEHTNCLCGLHGVFGSKLSAINHLSLINQPPALSLDDSQHDWLTSTLCTEPSTHHMLTLLAIVVDILNMVAGVIIYNWLYHRSGNSVLLVMIIHSMNNAVSGEFFSPMFTGIYSVQQAWMRTLVWGVAAVIVLVANWRWWTGGEESSAVQQPAALEPITSN